MEPELLDCHWCGSARSVEHGICQICLMDYPYDAEIIRLPLDLERTAAQPGGREAGAAE